MQQEPAMRPVNRSARQGASMKKKDKKDKGGKKGK
jgi:hypothetical protein